VLRWIQQIALEGAAYKNEVVEIFGEEGNAVTTEGFDSMWCDPEPEAAETGEASGDQTQADGEAVEATRGDIATKNETNGKATPVETSDASVAETLATSFQNDDNQLSFSPVADGPEAKDMVELVTEIEDLKLHH